MTPEERRQVLKATRAVTGKKSFVAGAFVEGLLGEPLKNYLEAVAEIQEAGGIPILFQCSHFKKLKAAALIKFYTSVGEKCEQVLAFELGEMFAPFGSIYTLEIVRELMQIPRFTGMKHSSLSRELEWQRLEVRDKIRPEFKIYTGNDLAIDMVIYGSDYLLGLSAFTPEAFAARDCLWKNSDSRFFELNDLLQYLGCFAFRAPVPAYKHTAAQFLHLRKKIKTNLPHPKSQSRPDRDVEILRNISDRLDQMMAGLR